MKRGITATVHSIDMLRLGSSYRHLADDRTAPGGASDHRLGLNGQKMTGDKSRLLKVGDRVCWGAATTDLGTIAATAWSGVTIDWDDGHSSSVQHNDMGLVTVVPLKI